MTVFVYLRIKVTNMLSNSKVVLPEIRRDYCILYAKITFYKYYQGFQANTSVYYFDDYYSENFVDDAIGELYKLHDDIVGKNDIMPIGAERKQRDDLKKFLSIRLQKKTMITTDRH